MLTVGEITRINDAVEVETEVFAFGGMCVMAEGRCLLSSYATGESPNMNGICSPAEHVHYEERDGQLVNVYNEDTLRWLVARGATRICLPPELPREAIARLAESAGGAELEVQVFGRMPLALSARCYHARARGLHKDGCQYVCDLDPDGMAVDTLDGEPFLANNGIQTLSHAIVELSGEIDELLETGITRFRLSPHKIGMITIADAWRGLLEGNRDLPRARRIIESVAAFALPSNGYLHGRPGADMVAPRS